MRNKTLLYGTSALMIVFLASCASKQSKPVPLAQGKVTSPDGRLLEERVVLNFNRKPEELYQVYRDSAGNFIRHGYARHYYLNGQMKFEEHFKEGRLDSITEFWYESGGKQGELPFQGGKPHGLALTWHQNGKKKSEKPWVDGKLHGLSREWDKKGNLIGEQWWEHNTKVTGPTAGLPPVVSDPASGTPSLGAAHADSAAKAKGAPTPADSAAKAATQP